MQKRQDKLKITGLRRCAGGWTGFRNNIERRGSAIVLVLVTIVLMALLATTLLQVTRFERIPRPESNIDIVVESVVAEIANQLTDDLLDDDGNLFNIVFDQSTSVKYVDSNKGGDEPWDYPWTNRGSGFFPPPGFFGREAVKIDGREEPVYGGAFDDTWLASTAPDFRGSVAPNSVRVAPTNTQYGVWPKITQLTGLYLYGDNNSSDLSTRQAPVELPIASISSEYTRDMNIPIPALGATTSLVDADGDGIGDSRWEWAPLRQIGSTRYVMAVRIVDLSARLDLNVAIGRGAPADDASVLRGTMPTELDGHLLAGELAAGATASASQARNEWRDALNFRMTGDTVASPISGNSATRYGGDPAETYSRRHYWQLGASRVTSNFVRNGSDSGGYNYSQDATFRLVDAFELLKRNGLNSSTTTKIEELMPRMTRKDADEATNFSDSATVGNGYNQRDFWELDFRKQVSPFTGAMNVRRPYKHSGGVPIPLESDERARVDVNAILRTYQRSNRSSDLSKLYDVIFDVFSVNYSELLNSMGPPPGSYAISFPTAFCQQYTANIADYADADNRLTKYGNRWGFEALPYITEVYTQRLYNVSAPPTTDGDGNVSVTWAAAGNTGYAIEISNPFARYEGNQWKGRSINLKSVWIKIGNRGKQKLVDVDPAVPETLGPDQVLIIHRNSDGMTSDATMHDIDKRWEPAEDGRDVIAVTGQTLLGPEEITVQLFAEAQDGEDTALSWAYSACKFKQPVNNSISETIMAGTSTNQPPQQGHQGFVQTSYKGVGQGLRMMAVGMEPQRVDPLGFNEDESTLDAPSVNSDSMSGTPVLDGPGTEEPQFTKANKQNEALAGEFAGLNRTDAQLVWYDNPRERIEWIGDLLQVPLLGFGATPQGQMGLMSKALKDAGLQTNPLGVRAYLLPYKRTTNRSQDDIDTSNGERQAATIDSSATAALPVRGKGYGMLYLPHSLMLLEQLTTYQPATDGFDADGGNEIFENQFPDLDELLVPGKINLNTVTEETLVNILPYHSRQTRVAVAREIIQRREFLKQNSDGQNGFKIGPDDIPAIKTISSLYQQFQMMPESPSQDNADTATDGTGRIDFNNYEPTTGRFEELGGNPVEDGIIDDREEELMLVKWLHQVGETRSDVFAAYIIVQGYPAEDFSGGAIESARLIVVFSRAGVTGDGDRAVEIGRFRFK